MIKIVAQAIMGQFQPKYILAKVKVSQRKNKAKTYQNKQNQSNVVALIDACAENVNNGSSGHNNGDAVIFHDHDRDNDVCTATS